LVTGPERTVYKGEIPYIVHGRSFNFLLFDIAVFFTSETENREIDCFDGFIEEKRINSTESESRDRPYRFL
jgi:hypothetical protein